LTDTLYIYICNDSLPARSFSNIDSNTGAVVCIAPSSVIQEDIGHFDSPDTSDASSGQNAGERHVIADAQSESSHGTEHTATVQSGDVAAEQENFRFRSSEIFQRQTCEGM
jgi:hypothetical protein